MEYYIKNKTLYVTESMSKIGDIAFILAQEVTMINGNILSIKQILEDPAKYFPTSSLDLEIKGKCYKAIFTKIGSGSSSNKEVNIRDAQKLFIVFIDISNEFAKYLHMENNYKHVQKKKDLLRIILDNIPVAVWSRDENMEIAYFNNTYSDIVFGYQKAFDKELLEIDKNAILSAQKAFSENIPNVNQRPVIVDGKRYLYQITDTPLVANNMVLSVAWDVTNQEVLQKEMQEILSSHQNLLESSSNACMIIAQDGRLKYYNDALVKFWGLDESVLTNDVTHEEILDHAYTRRKLPEQYNYTKFKKERNYLLNTLTGPREDLFYLPDGKCLRCVVIPHAGNSTLFTYEDVTEKLSLQRLNHTLSAVQKFTIDNLQEGICVFNESGELELVNATMTNLWGISIDKEDHRINLAEVIDKISGECENELESEELKDAFTKVMVSRISAQQTIKNSRGSIVHRSMTPLPNRGIMISDLDITASVLGQNALTEKNEALIYVDKIKSEFLANMSYGLRNPLTSIIRISQLLLLHEFENLSTSQKNHISDLILATEALSNLVDDAIEITSISSGYADLLVEEFDLKELIREIAVEFADHISAKELSCVLKCNLSEAFYISDRSKMKQALSKLLENSIYRSKNISRIDIDLREENNIYILSITDDGPSIDDNTSMKTTGLRYILARAIIILLQGSVTSKYSQKTGFSSFIIELPKFVL